ncbi:DUF3298 and DUF4163 domain-containing protein [Anoxybacteroides tepidamans]|uniref:DUF3298 and DUF4163 domain-containing protein n=1 Tax=Anoxybacteroides tepidamans TaxID=265948 RepID=UPI000481488B|nr:DUF3298 and DUF4163 domain-containing protein [Anoxybacillus tepidamans]
MKKLILGIAACSVLMFGSFSPHMASATVLWDGKELKKGQIGRVTVLQQTELYRLNGAEKEIVKKLKPGEVYRVYTFLSGKLGLGVGQFVDRDGRVKYETPSKEKRQALGVAIVKQRYKNAIDYPQVSGLMNKSAENQINETIQKHVRASYNALVRLKEQEKTDRQRYLEEHGYPVPPDEEGMYTYDYSMSYEVKYNENHQLSLLIYDYMYTGGAHGMSNVTSYNFDVRTGKLLKLGDVAKTKQGLNKIKKYAVTDLMNRANRGEMIFTDSLSEIQMNNDRPFYFNSNGIVVKFFEYEVAPYAAGMPEVKIPYSVFR